MTDEEILKKEPVQLDLFSDPENIDDSDERAFVAKCNFIEQQRYVDFPDITRVYLPDFVSEIFERPQGDLKSVEPFEERGAERYKKWREEENAKKEHDYSEGQFEYCPIVFFKKPRKNPVNGKKRKDGTDSSDKNIHVQIFKEDYQRKDWLQNRYFSLMAPITYVGKSPSNANARYLYAFTIDLDGVGLQQLEVLFLYFHRTFGDPKLKGLPIIPIPNIIVNSGHGLHLYYIMRWPLALYQWNAKLLQQFIRYLYKLVWYPAQDNGEPGTSTEKKLHCLGIYHAFRLPETLTKPLKIDRKTNKPVGQGVPIRAWKLRSEHYTLSDFSKYFVYNDYLRKTFSPKVIAELERGGRMLNPHRLSLEEARKRYGEEWYQNRDKPKGRFYTDRRLYDWWLNKISDPFKGGVKEGHRYFCIMALAAFAKKCGVEKKELVQDAESLLNIFERLTTKADNHFRMFDIHRAIEAYDKDSSIRWSPGMIEHWTDIEMKKTKRNRRKQATHLKMARSNRDILAEEKGKENWWEGGGRPEGSVITLENSRIAARIEEWMLSHPDSHNKSACARDLDLDRKTVRKWWKQIEEQSEDSLHDVAEEEISEDLLEEIGMGAGLFEGELFTIPDLE